MQLSRVTFHPCFFFFLTFLLFLRGSKEYNKLITQYLIAITRNNSIDVVCQQTLSTPVHFTEHPVVPSFQCSPPIMFHHKPAFHQLPYDATTDTCNHPHVVFSDPFKRYYLFLLHACSHAELPCVLFFFCILNVWWYLAMFESGFKFYFSQWKKIAKQRKKVYFSAE